MPRPASSGVLSFRRYLIFAFTTAVFIALITAIANATGQAYVLFPELGALAWVIFTDPKGSWATSPRLLVLTPFLTALLGVAITRSLPYGVLSLTLDVVGCLLLIRWLRSPIVPAISAGVLPLALGIHDWAYPASILVGTGGLALLSLWRSRRLVQATTKGGSSSLVPIALNEIESGFALTPSVPLLRWGGGLAVFLALGLAFVKVWDSPLVLFPPLLVIAYDMLALPNHSPWMGRGGVMMVVGTAAAWVSYGLVTAFGVTPLAAFLAVLVTLGLLRLARLTCPPCLGLALLPFVISHPSANYPWQALTGMTCLVAVVATMEACFPRASSPECS